MQQCHPIMTFNNSSIVFSTHPNPLQLIIIRMSIAGKLHYPRLTRK